MHEFRRQADRQFPRQGEVAKGKFRGAPFRRRFSDQNGQGMTGDSFLLKQVRQQSAILGLLALRGDQLNPRARPRRDRRLHQADIAFVVRDDAVQGVDLRTRGGQRHRLGGDVGGEGLIGGVELEALIFQQRSSLLDRAPFAAEQVTVGPTV